MTSKKTLICAALTLAAVGTALTGCSGGGGDGSTELTFWDGNAIPERTQIWKDIIADFEAENPDIRITYVGLPQDSSGQKFDNAIATNSAPDFGVIPRGDVSSYQAQDALLPLDDLLADSELADELEPSYLDQIRANVPDGKLYALPTHALQDVIWYRPDLFEAAGLEPPQTWDEFSQAAEQLTDTQTGQFGFTIRGGEGAGYHLLSDMYAASGITEIVGDDGKTTLADPLNVAAVEKLAALYKTATPEADVTNTYPKMLAQFQAGNIAMMQHNIGSYPTVRETFDESQVAPLPLPRPDADSGEILVSSSLASVGIMKSSEHQDESWRFLEFAMDHENNSRLAEQAAGIPVNIDARSDAWVTDSPAIQQAVSLIEDPTTVVVQAPSYLPEWSGIIRNDVEPLFQKVLLGEATAQELLTTWADLTDEALAKYDARQN